MKKQKFTPYSKNIIFMDAEFTGLSATGTTFLSIALIKVPDWKSCHHQGCGVHPQELYLEIEIPGDAVIDPWVTKNVIPLMTGEKVSVEETVRQINDFVGGGKPYMIADVPAFDWVGICGMCGIWNVPFYYIPIDFASILFSLGIDPDIDRDELSEKLNVRSEGKKHDALADCRNLKDLYFALKK